MNPSEIKKAQRIIYLVTGYKKDSLSESEKEELGIWMHGDSQNLDLFNELKNNLEEDKALRIMDSYAVDSSFENLKAKMMEEVRLNHKKRIYKWITAAAAIILVVSVGFYFLPQQLMRIKAVDSLTAVKDVPPGNNKVNKATLTLADGRKVELSGDKRVLFIKADGLTYDDGTNVISKEQRKAQETASNKAGELRDQYSVISIPKGAQYQVVLSEGTKIWLNSASSLKYPTSFTGNERRVELTGEAYFEVAHNKAKPFKVISNGQEVEVLGTHFNINSYPDEEVIKTTLIEGSVLVSAIPTKTENFKEKQQNSRNFLVLKPNQQSIITKESEGIKVIKVNPASVLDWKNGDFIFDADIKTIMRQISRWYNIEVVYEGNITEEEFGGRVSRSKNLTEVLKVLQETNKVHFKLGDATVHGSERRVIVMP